MTERSSSERQSGALKNLLDGFPDIGADMFMGDSDEEFGENRADKGNRGEPLTPPLSLPDSFDEGEYVENFRSSSRRDRRHLDSDTKSGGGASYKEVSRLQSLLVERSEKFRDLSISENMYNELRLRPESDLSLYELAQLKTHEFTVSTRREVEKLRRNLQDTSNELISDQARAEEATAQLSRQTKKMLLDADSAKLEIATLEERCTRLALRLKDETTMRQEGEEKSMMFDRQQKTLEQTQKEFSALKTLYEQQSSSLAQLTISEGASRTAERDLERTKELLSLDKAHLSQELRSAEARADQASKNAELQSSKVTALEMKNQALADQLLHAQLNGSTGMEVRMEKETARIRDEALSQVEQIKSASRDVTDRENKVLREAKEAAETAQEQLKRSVEHLTTENMRLQTDLIQAQSQAASDVAEIRADLKLKTFELAIIGTTMEEKMSLYRQMEAQLNTTKDELHAHRQAFLRLEAESEVSMVEIRTQFLAAKSRLAAYEALEEEIDNAVLRVAQAGQIKGSGDSAASANDAIDKENVSNVVDELASSAFFTSLKNMPSHPERRARQAVLLAQKVLETEKQRDDLNSLILKLKQEVKTTTEAKDLAEHALKRVAHPTVYLVTKLRDEEAAHLLCRDQLKEKDVTLRRVLQQKDKILADNEAIRERMRLMLHQRGEIDQLRGLLETLQSPESVAIDDINRSNNAPPTLSGESFHDLSGLAEGLKEVESPKPLSTLASLSTKPPALDMDKDVRVPAGSGTPTPTAAHSQFPLVHTQPIGARAPSPEQVARMTTSPTSESDRGKWHTRENI